MDARKTEKAAAVAIALFVTVLSFVHVHDWTSVGIYERCPLLNRLVYPFFHANVFHAVLNAWCLLSLVFIYDITCCRLVAAYIVAVAMPVDSIGALVGLGQPTVGLSGAVFVLFGSISCEVARKRYYQAWMCFYICIGFLFPVTNAWLHLYCYVMGLIGALLNCPFKRRCGR